MGKEKEAQMVLNTKKEKKKDICLVFSYSARASLVRPPFISPNEVENDMLLTVVREPYIVPAEKTRWGNARGRVVVQLPNSEQRRWTMNTTTWDRLIDDFGAEPSAWLNKKIRVKKEQQTVTGELKTVVYGLPYHEPQQPLAE